MAKKKVETACGCAPAMVNSKPRLWIDLNEDNIDILDDVTVGKNIVVAIKGKVVSAAKRENEYEGEGKKVTGEFQLESIDVELMTMNDFEALADD